MLKKPPAESKKEGVLAHTRIVQESLASLSALTGMTQGEAMALVGEMKRYVEHTSQQ